MAQRYRVVVNGQAFEVEVEELGGDEPRGSRPVSAPGANTAPVAGSSPAARVVPPSPPAPPAKPARGATPPPGNGAPEGQGETVQSPLPGTVLDVKVASGDTVAAGHVLCILEAMKMENEVTSPRDGRVLEIYVSKGEAVNLGDALFLIG